MICMLIFTIMNMNKKINYITNHIKIQNFFYIIVHYLNKKFRHYLCFLRFYTLFQTIMICTLDFAILKMNENKINNITCKIFSFFAKGFYLKIIISAKWLEKNYCYKNQIQKESFQYKTVLI